VAEGWAGLEAGALAGSTEVGALAGSTGVEEGVGLAVGTGAEAGIGKARFLYIGSWLI